MTELLGKTRHKPATKQRSGERIRNWRRAKQTSKIANRRARPVSVNAALVFALHIVALKCMKFLLPDWAGNGDYILKCETANTSMFIRKKDCSLASLAGSDEVSRNIWNLLFYVISCFSSQRRIWPRAWKGLCLGTHDERGSPIPPGVHGPHECGP